MFSRSISDGKVNGDKILFKTTVNGNTIPLALTISTTPWITRPIDDLSILNNHVILFSLAARNSCDKVTMRNSVSTTADVRDSIFILAEILCKLGSPRGNRKRHSQVWTRSSTPDQTQRYSWACFGLRGLR